MFNKEILKNLKFPETGVNSGFTEVINGMKVVYSESENEIMLKVTRVQPEFYDWCKDLDDELFETACDRFTKESDMSLKQFDEKIKAFEADDEIALFKRLVGDAAMERIAQLQKYVR